jgi:hypothetical protein
MFLLALLIEFLLADFGDVVFVAVLFDNFATRLVVVAFVETLTDAAGSPLSIVIAPANINNHKLLEATIKAMVIERHERTGQAAESRRSSWSRSWRGRSDWDRFHRRLSALNRAIRRRLLVSFVTKQQ